MNDGMLKGKDIKQKGDCLVHCFIYKITVTCGSHNNIIDIKPSDFEKW